MNARFSLLAAALLTTLFAAPAGAATETIWHETFDNIGTATTKWDSTGTSLSSADVDGWSVVSGGVYTGQKGVRVGAAKTAAVFKSPAIVPINRVNGINVVVNCAAYFKANGTQYIKIEVVDDSGNNLATFGGAAESGSLDGELTQHTSADAVEIPTTSGYMKAFTIPVSAFSTSRSIYLVFSCDTTYPSSQNRILIGDVLVSQATASSLEQLDEPTGLRSSDVGYFGFSLSWNPVTDANNGYEVSLSPAEGSVDVNGTTATVTGLAEETTYTASVVAKGDGTTTDDSIAATIDVTTATAPAVVAPALTSSDVSSSSLTVSWPAQDAAASYGVRAWTLVPADVATEDFAGYPDIEPEGWTFNNGFAHYTSQETIVKLANDGESVVSETYPAPVSSLSFKVKGNSANESSLAVSGTSDGTNWSLLTNIVFTTSTKVNDIVLDHLNSYHFTAFKWAFSGSKGGAGLGTVSVTGTGVGKQPSYLTGYGPDATGVGTASSVTLTPVAGEKNYVEVTAVGQTGKTATATLEVDVPSAAESASVVISVR